jgi:hypothetical protein
MPCVFDKATENLSDEHVFPAFTGANLVVKEGSCKKCNQECSKFEDGVATLTETARHIFDIPNRCGRVPSTSVGIEVTGTGLNIAAVGRRTSDGEIQLYDFVRKTKAENGKNIRDGFFVSQESAEKFIQRSQARGEKVTELDVPKEVTLTSSSQQTIEFAFSADMRRTVAKIALVSVANQYGTDYGCLPQFDALRGAIMGSESDLPLRVFANADFASDYTRTPRQHSVRTYLSAGMHKGWALVTLFGGLSYVVELTNDFQERDSRHFSLFYDTGLQAPENPIVLYDEQEIIGRVLSPATVFEQPQAIDAQWYSIVERYCRENGIDLSRTVASKNGD